MDEPVCKRGKLTDTDSTYTNTHLDEISDNELCLPFINQFSYDIDKQDITQNSSMEDSSRGIDPEPTPNNTVKEQIYWPFNPPYQHFQLTTMVSCHMTMKIQNQEKLVLSIWVQADLLEVRYLQLKWSVTCNPYPQAWRTLLNNVKVPVHINTSAPRSYMTKDFYELHPFLIDHTKCKADIDKLKMANGACLPIKFMIPLVISFEGHMFEILTLVSGTKGEVLLVLGMKSIVEMEGTLCSKTMSNM